VHVVNSRLWFPPANIDLVLALPEVADETVAVHPGYTATWCAWPSPWTVVGLTPHPLSEKVEGPPPVAAVSVID
jgi:hypothetical protein